MLPEVGAPPYGRRVVQRVVLVNVAGQIQFPGPSSRGFRTELVQRSVQQVMSILAFWEQWLAAASLRPDLQRLAMQSLPPEERPKARRRKST